MAAQHRHGFVGRSSERETLRCAVDHVRGGQSAVLVIRGEAGIGKTALLAEARDVATGFRVVEIAGVESEMELPFAGLHQLCGSMLGRLGTLPPPQRSALSVAFGLEPGDAPDRFLVALAVLTLLSDFAEQRPLLCVIDDAHWLDAASAQVLGFVARRLLAESVALLFAVREPSATSDLAGLPDLPLGRLDTDEARALLTSVIPGRLDEGVRDRIVAETHGNPLALLEFPRGLTAAELAGGFMLPSAGDVRGRIEEHYLRRVDALPAATQRLMLLASADPVGDATILWRAAQHLDLDPSDADAATGEHLLEIDAHVRFRHPLVRSAVYRAAPGRDRRAVHAALAAATDARTDRDRRAWHLAHAATGPDAALSDELTACAGGAQRRGGKAAAAAFLERAAVLTPDPPARASRSLTAARAKFETGDFAAAEALLASADAGPLNDLEQATVELTRAQMSFDQRRGRDAPQLLLQAALRLEPLDAQLARETHLEALVAAIYAGRLANGDDVARVGEGARAAPMSAEPLPAEELLLLGLAIRLTDGCTAAAPVLRRALDAYRADERRLDRMCLAYNIAAEELWDDEAWLELASAQADLARTAGALLLLPYALDYLAGVYVQQGELGVAGELLAEAEGLDLGVRPEFPLRLAAFRGQPSVALPLVGEMNASAEARGEGCAIAAVGYSEAVLYNGLGQYAQALDAAQKATATDDIVTSSWSLHELVEAAARAGRPEVAQAAASRLGERAAASGTPWALGAAARSSALVAQGPAAEELYREAVDRLAPTRMAWYLARARLNYGEWLRRENRRVDARAQLREAHELFEAMGSAGFAERARRELLATGEKVRRRREDTRDDLTPQEEQIARLARAGGTNAEIGAQLFLSPRTVEWHLRKVFAKLGISSRMGLHDALPERASDAAPV